MPTSDLQRTRLCVNNGASSRLPVLRPEKKGVATASNPNQMTAAPVLEMDPRAHDGSAAPFPLPPVSPAEMTGTWVVAQVQANKARSIAATLGRVEGMGFYYPLERVEKRYGPHVRREWSRALFPGYIFACCGDDEAEYSLRRIRDGVKNIIAVRDQARFVREITGVYLACLNGSVSLYRLPVAGQRCRVTEGGLRGIEGVLVSTANRWHFVLEVSTLGQRVEAQVPPEWLEPVGDEAAA
jgi:hypothetical protein